jgi:autotransporter translocation and assembly factor TamB
MRGWARRALVLLTVVGLLLAAAVGTAWILFRMYGPDLMRAELERALSSAFGRPAHVGAVTFRPWPAGLRVSGVTVTTDDAVNGGDAIKLDHADIGIRLESAWRRQIVLAVRLTGLDLTTSPAGGEGAGLAGLALPSTFMLGGMEIRVGLIRLERGRIVYRDPGAGWALEARGIEAEGRPRPPLLALSARAESLRLESSAGEERVERLQLEGTIGPGEIRLEPSRLVWLGHEVRLSGGVTQPAGSADTHVTLRGELPLAAAGQRAGLTGTLSGVAAIDAALDGPLAAPRVDARVAVPELMAGPVRARNVRLEGRLVDGTLRVSDLRADLPGGAVTGELTVSPGTTAGVRTVELTLDGLHLPYGLAALGPGALRARARLVGRTVELGPATARWADALLDVAGRFEPGQSLALHANLDGQLGRLAQAIGSQPIDGRIRATADAVGPVERPVVTVRVETERLVVGTQPVGRLELTTRLEGTGGFTRWAGTLGAARFAGPPAAVENLQGAFTLDADQLDLQRLTARVAGVPLDLRGTWKWNGTGRARADLGPVALGGLRDVPPALALAGTGSGRIDITVGPDTSATAQVGLSDVSLRDIRLGTGRLDATLHGRDLTANLEFPGARLSASTRGRLEAGRPLPVQARVERFDLDPVLRQLAPDARRHVRAAVSTRVDAELPLDRPEATRGVAWISPDELTVAGERWTAGAPAIVRWDSDRLSIEQLQVRGPRGTLSAEGAVDRRSGDGRAAVRLEDARLRPPLDRLGRGAVRGEARLARNALEDVSLHARWPTWALTVDGRIPFEAPMALRGRLTADVAEVGRIGGLDGVAGQAVVTADVSGPWRAPAGAGRIEVPTLTIAGQSLARVTVPFQLAQDSLRIAHASARLGSDPIALDGSAMWKDGGWRAQGLLTAPALTIQQWPIRSPRIAFTADAAGLALTEVALSIHETPVQATASWPWKGPGHVAGRLGPGTMAAWPGLPPALAVDGTVSGRFEATGRSLDDATARAGLRLGDVGAGGVPLGAGTLDVELHDRVARADLRFPDRRLTVTATSRTTPDAVASIRGSVDGLSVEELVRRVSPGVSQPVEGTLSARGEGEVPIARPTDGHGTVRVDPVRIVLGGETLANREPITAVFDASGVRIDRFAFQGAAGSLVGHLKMASGGRLDAALRGQTPLTLLATLTPEVAEAGGTLDVTATVTGTTAAPVISGTGTVRGGSIRARAYADPVRDIEAEVTASPAGLRLTRAQGVLGGGTVTATGEAALADGGLGAYRFTLAARSVNVSPIEGLSSLWDGELALTGRGARGQLGGELRLLRGLYTRELAPASQGPVAAASATEPGRALPLHVLVKLDDNLVVRNRTARLRIGGTLTVEGTTAAPAVLGVVETREGAVAFRNRRFTVVTATARFVDPRRIDPFLDAVATARIRDYDVTARVSGRLDRLDVHLRSTPPLSEEDLLALVAFGATRAELERSPTGVIAGEAATSLVRDLLGLDPLGGETSASRLLGRFQVGTVVAEAPRGSEARTDQRVRVEYQLLGPLSLVGEQGQRGGYAAGVVLRLRFR